MFKNSPLKLTNENIRLFPERTAELDSFKFFPRCIVWMLQRYWLFAKKHCHLLFSISVVVGHFSCNWPGSSSQTVINTDAELTMFVSLFSHV